MESEKGYSSAPVSSAPLDGRMGERGTSGEFESLDSTITPTNASHEYQTSTCDYMNMIPHLLTFVIVSIGLAGNAVVLWLLGFRIRRNATSVYILNLAAANALFLSCHSFMSLMFLFPNYLYHPRFVLYISLHLTTVFYITGLGMISAISTERCLSILWPIWYRCKCPRHTSAVICALLWALSVLLGILKWYACYILDDNFLGNDFCMVGDFFIIAFIMLLCVTLLVSSLALLSRILCGSQHKVITRLYVTVVVTVLVFLLCGMPFGITLFLFIWIHSDFHGMACLYMATTILSCINSCANPFIYFFVGSFRQWQKKRQTVKMILQRALQDECGSSLPQASLGMSGSRGEQ